MVTVARVRLSLRASYTHCRHRIDLCYCLLGLLGFLAVTACTHNRHVPVEPLPPSDPPPGIISDGQHARPSSHQRDGSRYAGQPGDEYTGTDQPAIEDMLQREYNRWLGTRHRLGGNDHNGIDCSGFVREVYRNVFHIDLPRTTKEQVRLGQPVTYDRMRVGDLVFFKPPSTPRHVGIYLGENQFVHASKTNGVTVSPIDRYYWKLHFWTARRILTD